MNTPTSIDVTELVQLIKDKDQAWQRWHAAMVEQKDAYAAYHAAEVRVDHAKRNLLDPLDPSGGYPVDASIATLADHAEAIQQNKDGLRTRLREALL